jgi:archaemetzincin
MGEKKQVGGPALAKARAAATALLGTAPSPTALWFSRVAATVAHEVGHCMCLDHCQYYACFMGENEGQPVYACPVCLRKMLWTAGVKDVEELDAAACARYEAVALFTREPPCKNVKHFAALEAWCSVRAMQIKADL